MRAEACALSSTRASPSSASSESSRSRWPCTSPRDASWRKRPALRADVPPALARPHRGRRARRRRVCAAPFGGEQARGQASAARSPDTTAGSERRVATIVGSRARPRIVDSRATSALRAVRGGRPASPNQATRTWSPSSSQVPPTTPPTTTTGEIQPLCLLTAARRGSGTTRPSAVPGPRNVLVEAGQEPHRGHGCRRDELVEILGEHVRAHAVHVDLREPIRERVEPGTELALAEVPARQPVAEGVDRRRPVGAK